MLKRFGFQRIGIISNLIPGRSLTPNAVFLKLTRMPEGAQAIDQIIKLTMIEKTMDSEGKGGSV